TSSGIKAGYTLDGVPTHRRAHTHTLSFTHYGQFRDAHQPTKHVFGLGEETGVPGGNPQGTGRTCKLHTHTHTHTHTRRRRELNPQPWRDTSLSTLSGFKDARKHALLFPPVLNTLSEGELVAGMHKYFSANL
ncbi:hypothetical protein QTP70_027909, partial [Hemibagrus guttatus]